MVNPTLPAPAALMTRAALADALQARGFPITRSTLTTLASRGGGPPHSRWGKFSLYAWGDALTWAEGRLTAPEATDAPPNRATKAA